MADAKELGIGVFVVLLAIGTTYYIAEGDNAYYCEDRNIVGLCWKLSIVNAEGISTRCYYDSENPTRYKTCDSGWEVFKQSSITGQEEAYYDYITKKEEISTQITGLINNVSYQIEKDKCYYNPLEEGEICVVEYTYDFGEGEMNGIINIQKEISDEELSSRIEENIKENIKMIIPVEVIEYDR